MPKFYIEIRKRQNYGDFELLQHFLTEPKDILFPISHNYNIWGCDCEKFITEMAIKEFGIEYHQIKFTND